MSGAGRVIVAASLFILLAATSGRTAAHFPPPEWAYPQTPRPPFTPDPDDGQPKRLTGSTRAYTYQQIEDSFAPARLQDTAAYAGSQAP